MKNFVKAYDCSNSPERPAHRSESFGPKENDLIRGLKKYCNTFGYEFIDQPEDADVIITNDVFPKDILALNKPMVKRMDGVFWDKRFVDRNESLNRAAMQADSIIFISEYSKQSFIKLYDGNHPFMYVVLNSVDESVFFHRPTKKSKHFTWVASATNWAREEKRFDDLMVFADSVMDKDSSLVLIGERGGKCTSNHHNVIPVGYFENEKDTNDLLNSCDAFINLSYRDAAPKVVCQAVNCKLPILCAVSGGTPEIVIDGIGIKDDSDFVFEDKIPRLKLDDMRKSYELFNAYRSAYKSTFKSASTIRRQDISYMETLGQYFDIMSDTIGVML